MSDKEPGDGALEQILQEERSEEIYRTADAVNFVDSFSKEQNMPAGHIPVGSGDLPIDVTPLDESAVYEGVLKKATLSPKTDKNGNMFCQLQLEVASGDFEGKTVMMNYLPLPTLVTSDMSKGERIKAQDRSVAFERFCRAFKISGKMPAVSHSDVDSLNAWQDWASQFYESQGKFTIRNQEFPEGSTRLRSGVSDFIF